MEHTKGEWTYDGEYVESLNLDKPLSICTLAECKEKDANGQLIAAVPDLLAACKAMIDALKKSSGAPISLNPAYETMQQAISKAEKD